MKRLFFLLAISLMVFHSIAAQTNYHPFVQDGKVWTYKKSNMIPIPEYHWEYEETYSLEGYTIKNHLPCVKLYHTDPYYKLDHVYMGVLYEEDGKVYYMPKDSTTFSLLYDFSSEPGTTIKVGEYDLMVNERNLYKYRDEYWTVVNWSPLNLEDTEGFKDNWVEGIGIVHGGTLLYLFEGYGTWFIGGIVDLEKCELNGQVIYDDREFWTSAEIVTSIDNPSVQPSDNTTVLYDLQGRRVGNGQFKSGIYIVNGKKVLLK